MQIEMVAVTELNVPEWHATYILRPDLLVLADSLASEGFVSPLVVQRGTNDVIDGTQRLRLVMGNRHLAEMFPEVPVVYKDVSNLQAMALHVQLNRGRGSVVAKSLSAIIRKLKKSRAFSVDDFARKFAMKGDELELMLDGTILKHRNVKNHSYSRAWVPVEAPPGTVEAQGAVKTESPPNADR
jgi:ParB-like chromosome segregation protein Spo0J